MNLLSSVKVIDNSKLFFSSVELSKILACYSLGVSRGSWKDYSIYFGVKEAIFCMYKHSYASPDCILTKTIKNRKNRKKNIIYNLELKNKNKSKSREIDDLICLLKRKELKVF